MLDFGTILFGFGFIFFLLLYIDKVLEGKISEIITHFYFRFKSHYDVEREDTEKKITDRLERIEKKIDSLFTLILNSRNDKRNKKNE